MTFFDVAVTPQAGKIVQIRGTRYEFSDCMRWLVYALYTCEGARVTEITNEKMVIETPAPERERAARGRQHRYYGFALEPGHERDFHMLLTAAYGFFEGNPALLTNEQRAFVLDIIRRGNPASDRRNR